MLGLLQDFFSFVTFGPGDARAKGVMRCIF